MKRCRIELNKEKRLKRLMKLMSFLFILILTSNMFTNVYAEKIFVHVDPKGYRKATMGGTCRETFVSKDRHWIIYKRNPSGYTTNLNYISFLPDEGPHIIDNYEYHDGARFSSWYQGDQISITWSGYAVDAKVYYRKGAITDIGVINWIKDQKTVVSSGRSPNIALDSNNYPWVSYLVPTTYNTLNVSKDYYNNGEWLTDFELNIDAGSYGNRIYYHTIIPLDDGQMYFIWVKGASLRGRLYNGTDLEPIEQITARNINADRFSASVKDNEIYLAYGDFDTNEMLFKLRDKNGVWKSEEIIDLGVNTDTLSTPSITVIDELNATIVFWTKYTNDNIYYNVRTKNGWIGTKLLLHEDYGLTNNGHISSFRKSFDGVVGLTWTANKDGGTEPSYVEYYAATIGEFIPSDYPPQINNVTVTTISGTFNNGTVWLFEKEVAELNVTVENADYVEMSFNDTKNIIKFIYNETNGDEMFIDVEGIKGNPDKYVIGNIYQSFTKNGNQTNLIWRFIPNINIVDSANRRLSYYLKSNQSGIIYEKSNSTNIDFNIYNLGGNVYYTFNGDGARIKGGDAWELKATDGSLNSYAKAEVLFRKLQHVHLLVEIDMGNDWNNTEKAFDFPLGCGYVEYGIDYRLNGSWVTGWKVRLYPYQADVGYHGLGNDQDWIEWSVDWYNYDPSTGSIQNIKTDYIYSNFWGYDTVDGQGHTNRTSTQMWIDLWFNKMNASTVIGGRVNSYYYGMYEQGNAYWFGYGKFRPRTGDTTASMFFDNLYDENGNVTNCLKYDLIKAYAKVAKLDVANGNDDTWALKNYEILNWKVAEDRMQGIDTPIFVETKVLDMPQTGFLAPLKKAIESLGKVIWNGALGFIRILWGAMDTLLSWAGFPKGTWERIVSFVLSIPQLIITLGQYLGTLVTSFIEILDDLLLFITNILPRYIYLMGTMIVGLISWWGYFVDLFTGGIGGINNIWQQLDLEQWIILFITVLFPLWEVDRIFSSKDPLKKLKEDFELYTSFLTGIANFIKSIINMMIQIISAIRGMLPF